MVENRTARVYELIFRKVMGAEAPFSHLFIDDKFPTFFDMKVPEGVSASMLLLPMIPHLTDAGNPR